MPVEGAFPPLLSGVSKTPIAGKACGGEAPRAPLAAEESLLLCFEFPRREDPFVAEGSDTSQFLAVEAAGRAVAATRARFALGRRMAPRITMAMPNPIIPQ
jgi:hypothetical protein